MKQTINFRGQNIYVGFDVHKKDWKVTIMADSIVHKSFTQPPEPECLVNYLKLNFPGATYYSAYEAGFSGYWIHYQLMRMGVKSIIVNPADIPTTQKEKVQKEDKRDSRKIARSLANGDLSAIHVPSQVSIEDRGLVRTRAVLVTDLSRYKHRIKSFLMFHGIHIPKEYEQKSWSKNFMNWLKDLKLSSLSGDQSLHTLIQGYLSVKEQVMQITKLIHNLSKTERYWSRVQLLVSIPGIGIVNAMTILTEIEDIHRFRNNDHFCSYVGLTPGTHSSGEKEIDTGITFRAHAALRETMIEAAWITVRKDPALLLAFQKYCKRMEKNKAIVRIAKKLTCRVQFVLREGKRYELLQN
jgi:transposase